MDKTIDELREERGNLAEEKKGLLDISEKDITDEQLDKLDEINKELAKYDEAIVKAEKKEKFKAEKIARAAAGGNGIESLSSEDKEVSKLAKDFMFVKALKQIKQEKALDGVEKELYEEAVHENKDVEGNIAIPEKFVRILRKGEKIGYDGRVVHKDLTIGTEGGDVRPLDLRGPIPILAPDPIVAQMGATVLQGLQGNLQFSRHNGAATMAWEGETDANAETTPTLNNVSLTPNRLGGFTDVSQLFVRQAHFDGEQFVRGELNRAFAQALDTAAINGSGSGSEPTGLLGLSIGASDVGTNGGAPTWAVIKGNYENVESANANYRNMAALTHPSVKYKLMEVPKQSSGVEGNFIISDQNNAVPRVLGYPVYSSTLVPANLTKGTGSSLSAYIVGDWSELVIAQWGGIDLLADPFTQATNGLIRIIINGYFDVNVMHAASFSASDDIDPS